MRTFLVLAGVLASPVWAQSGNQGSIGGIVTDPSGAVVPDVTVRITQVSTSVRFSTRSNGSGYFWFPVIPVGRYELVAERAGFATLLVSDLAVSVGAHVNVPLALAPARESESVVVTAPNPLIEPSRSQASTTVDSRSIASLPVNGRDFVSFALLTPGVTTDVRGGLSFGGQRAMNSVLVDGANYDDTFWGQALGGEGFAAPGTQGGYALSLDTVQEYQVNTNAYSAEFGRAAGGVINVLTKSGDNSFHGSAFWFFRDKSMNANNTLNIRNGLPKDPYHFNQAGAVLGGPIRKNRLFFLASYDALRSNPSNPVVLGLPPAFKLSVDPVVAAFQQRALDYLVPHAKSWNAPTTQNDYLAKIDWYPASPHLLSARWIRQGGFTQAAFGGPQTSVENTLSTPGSTDILTLSLNSTLRPSLVNVARITFARGKSDWVPASINPEAVVSEGGELVLTVGRCQCLPQRWSTDRFEWSDTISYVRGTHGVRAGVDVMPDRITYFTATRFSGSYHFRSLESFGRSLSGVPMPLPGDGYVQAFSGFGSPGVTTRPNIIQIAGFVQDEWRARHNLTLNLGLRYDVEAIARPPVKNPSPALAFRGLDTSLLRTDKNNIGPRLGFAWMVDHGDRLIVRGGYGIFYALTPAVAASRADSTNGVSVQTREFVGGNPGAELIPAYPNTICGPPDPSGTPPSCLAPPIGATAPSIFLFSADHREGYAQQGSLGMEVRLTNDAALSVSYLVVRGTHLLRARDINLTPSSAPREIGIAGTTTRLSYTAFEQPRPIVGFNRVLLYESSANSIYHGLAVQLNKRFSRTFQLLGSYTLGKVIDDNPNQYAVNPGAGDFQFLSDPSNARADRGPGSNDQRHRLALSGVWQPSYVSRLPGLARRILNGWQTSGILVAQSGQSYSGLVDFDLNHDGNSATDRTPGLGRNTFYLPRTVTLDGRLAREVPLTERMRLQFIWEGFNLFNHANVGDVQRTQHAFAIDAAACGIAGVPCLAPVNDFRSPIAYLPARIMQLAVRLIL